MKFLKILMQVVMLLVCLNGLLESRETEIKITDNLKLIKISDNIFIHISYYDYPNYKHVPANGLVYLNKQNAIIIDTGWRDEETRELVNWLTNKLKVDIKGVVVTHWHIDCMVGLKEIHNGKIKSYAHYLTVEMAQKKGLPVPKIHFKDSLSIKLNDKTVICRYLGAGHTVDNIVVWIPAEKLLFGGCLLKALEWKHLGYIKDADLHEWPVTLNKVLKEFSDSRIVIPGHGRHGDLSLVHHTLELLKKEARKKQRTGI